MIDVINKIILIVVLIILISCATYTIYSIYEDDKQTEINSYNNNYKYVIQLPNDYKLISADSNRPDILLSYVKNDTLFIQFRDN